MATRTTSKKSSEQPKRLSKGWLESLKTQGSITVYDPNLM